MGKGYYLQKSTSFLSICLCFFIGSITAHAQNLVPNPDFDTFLECPTNRGQISRAAPWYSPNGKTTDFAHVCANNEFQGIPLNRWGEEPPFAGNGYAGIRTWGRFNDNGPYREYLAVKLLDSLKAGENYRVNFRVSLGDSARYGTDDIAIHFSRDSIPNLPLLSVTPHVENPQGRVISLPFGWQIIEGIYTAQGGEQHIVIGNFLDDDQTTLEFRDFPDDHGANSTYFYIDHVVVEPCSPEFPNEILLASDSVLCPGESINLAATTIPFATYSWGNGITDSSLQVSQPGIYTLEIAINGCSKKDSIEILKAPTPVFELGLDTLLCPGTSIQIGAQDPVDSYRWNDQYPSLIRTVEKPGLYELELSLGSCIYSESVQISYEDEYEFRRLQDTLICQSAPITLSASVSNASYRWSDLSDQMSFQTAESGQYWVDIETQCFSARELFNIEAVDCSCESFIPNVFSPNGDGIQDRFQLEYREGISEYSFEIFDRYGRPFFRSKNPEQSWDGRLNGKNASEGVYYWVARYTCFAQGEFRQQVKKGHVSLLR